MSPLLRHVPLVRVLLLAAPIAVFSWRTHAHHHRPVDEVAQANWLEDGIRFHFDDQCVAELQKPIGEVHFDRPPLADVLALLQKRSGLPFDVKWNTLALARVTPRTVLWARIDGMNLGAAIDQVCSEIGAYQGDVQAHLIGRGVTIARPQDFEADTVTRVYPIQDLLDEYERQVRVMSKPDQFPRYRSAKVWAAEMLYEEGAVCRSVNGTLYVTAPRWRFPAVYQRLADIRQHSGQRVSPW